MHDVLFPTIPSWMEEGGDLSGVGINAGQVRALVEIARWAGEREVRRVIRATVLSGDDVFDVKAKAENSSGRRQYSQRSAVRWRTRRLVAASIRRAWRERERIALRL
jgi:hypothetical protein